jgi:hypothetical protein
MSSWKLLCAAALATLPTATDHAPVGMRATPLLRGTTSDAPRALALMNERGRPACGNIGQRGQADCAATTAAVPAAAPAAPAPAPRARATPLLRATAPASVVPADRPVLDARGRPACSNLMGKSRAARCGSSS